MMLDKNLTPQQLWTIAADSAHRTHDLLDEIVDHPSTYRSLSDWAVAALAEPDLSTLQAPPQPEEPEPASRRSLRVPSVSLPRAPWHPQAPAQAAVTPAPAPTQAGMGAWLASAPVPAPTPVPAPVRSGTTAASGWLRRPAPMGLVLVLAVLQLLTVLALAAVGARPSHDTTQAPSPAATATAAISTHAPSAAATATKTGE